MYQSKPSNLKIQKIPMAAACIAMATGGIVLLGWLLNLPILTKINPSWVSMKANTAIAFIFLGLSLVFLLKDNGIGFDMKYVDKIFMPFQHLHRSDQYKGTGIGLTTCQKIARHHNGSIRADSAAGQGATFTVSLPTA